MAHKHLLLEASAREKILRGATALAEAVRITLGPKSRLIVIQRKWGRPLVCDDGVTIAKEFGLEDPDENLGAQVLREAAERTGEAVGDGTTTSMVLAHALQAEGMKNLAAGASAVDVRRGIERGMRVAIEAIRTISRPVLAERERMQVATIFAHNDPDIGKLVAEAITKVGVTGRSRWRRQKGSRPRLKSSRECRSTGAICLRTSSPILSGWRSCSRMP